MISVVKEHQELVTKKYKAPTVSEVFVLGVNMINSKYFQCVFNMPHRGQPVC